jgi:hypothetical protein
MTFQNWSSKNFCNKGFEEKLLDMISFVLMVKHGQKHRVSMMIHFSFNKGREEGTLIQPPNKH